MLTGANATPGLVVLDAIRKKAEHSLKNKSVISTPLLPFHQLLPQLPTLKAFSHPSMKNVLCNCKLK